MLLTQGLKNSSRKQIRKSRNRHIGAQEFNRNKDQFQIKRKDKWIQQIAL